MKPTPKSLFDYSYWHEFTSEFTDDEFFSYLDDLVMFVEANNLNSRNVIASIVRDIERNKRCALECFIVYQIIVSECADRGLLSYTGSQWEFVNETDSLGMWMEFPYKSCDGRENKGELIL